MPFYVIRKMVLVLGPKGFACNFIPKVGSRWRLALQGYLQRFQRFQDDFLQMLCATYETGCPTARCGKEFSRTWGVPGVTKQFRLCGGYHPVHPIEMRQFL